MRREYYCALTHLGLGVSERQVVIIVPTSASGQDGPWELMEVARVNGDAFDAVAAQLGYENSRIPGIEPSSDGKVWPSVVRRFHFHTFVAIKPPEDVQNLVAALPFLAPYVQDTRRCMTGGDERVRFLRGAGSTRALRPAVAL